MNLDSSTIWIIVAVVALLAFYFYKRSRPAPSGTYDDKQVRSSGSIGGGNRAYDDPEHRSSGSIGGSTTSQRTTSQVNSDRTMERDVDRDLDRDARGIDRDSPLERLADERAQPVKETAHNQDGSQRQHDDDRFKSKGSIGG